MKEDEKFRLKMMETVDAETLEWAQKASTEFAKRMSYYKCVMCWSWTFENTAVGIIRRLYFVHNSFLFSFVSV